MSLAEPQFERVAGTRLYWLDGSSRTIGFFSSTTFGGSDRPLLSATWTDEQGVYLFVGVAPASDASFAAALPGYLASQGWPNGPKFLWLQNPNVATWVGQTLNLAKGGKGWTVSRRADFRLSNYTLTVTSGSTVTLAAAAQNWGFAFTGGTIAVATFFAPGGQYDAAGGQLLLPFAGGQSGCWRFSITLSNGSGSPNDFSRLSVGVRYFYPGAQSGGRPFVRALHLTPLMQPAASLKLDTALDPLRPTTPDRSWLSFFPLNGSLPAFGSTFATARGYGVELTPLAALGALPDARLVFSVQPRAAGPAPAPIDYYLAPQGAYSLTFHTSETVSVPDSTGATIHRLLCGASGLEYLGMPSDQPAQLVFVPGKNAFAPLTNASTAASPLTSLGTTSWVWASSGDGVRYYAQPEDAPLFKVPDTTKNDAGSFLDYFEVPALRLAPPDGVRAFPLAPYRGLSADEVKAALQVEAAALAPARRQAILAADVSAWAAPAREKGAPRDATVNVGVTPQGLAVGVGTDGIQWTWVGIGNDTDAARPEPNLIFTKADGAFRQALETNRLFMVAANGETFLKNASVRYQLTAEGIAELRVEGSVPATVLNPVAAYFESHRYPVFRNEDDFVTALVAASSGAASYKLQFQRKSGLLMPRVGDWRFQISPRNWNNPDRPEHRNVLMVFKFNIGRSLAEMTDDVASWTWPEVAAFPGGTVADAQAELQSIYRAARDAYTTTSATGQTSPYANFIGVLNDKNWTGIIVFSCDMPLRALPGPLQALAAGIDPKRFYAHHVGFSITPFAEQQGGLRFGKSSMFGLLDYQDPQDQYFEDNRAYMFKVLQLTVGFRNSVMVDFASRVQLLVNRFFGAPARLFPTDHGNNVNLHGVYQRQKDSSGVEHGTYVFSMERQNTVGMAGSALRWAQLLSTQLVTTKAADPANPSSKVVALFQMGGNLYFYEPVGFDPFSFGQTREEELAGKPAAQAASALRFGNLGVRMEFTMAERKPSFTFVTEALSFDLSNSAPRRKALYGLFPLRLAGIVAAPDPAVPVAEGSAQGPDSFGYVSVGAPIQQARLRDPWYGLVYEIDLGTLGALAGSAGLTLNLLVAWSAGGTGEEPAVYVGVRLPGMKDALGVELPLQGILTLGFRSIQLLADDDEKTGKRQYLLRFRNFAIRFLGLAFPPGYNDILLAGNPDSTSPTKLGWYAAYAADEDPKRKKQPSRTARLVNARRLPASLLGTRNDE